MISISRCQQWRDAPEDAFRALSESPAYADLRRTEANAFFEGECVDRVPSLEMALLTVTFASLDADARVTMCEEHTKGRTRSVFETFAATEVTSRYGQSDAPLTVERVPLRDLSFADFDGFLEQQC